MRAYTLRRSMSPKDGADGVDYELCGLQALDDREAVEIARTMVDSDDSRLLTVELCDANERTIWGLRRGATISTRPDEAES